MGPFKLIVSKVAQHVNYKDIDEIKRNILTQDISFDPRQHDIFLFFVLPEFIQNYKGSKKTIKKKSYSKVDRVIVRIELPTTNIKLLGMYPISRTITATYEKPSTEFIPISGKLKALGRDKDAIKRGKSLIIANRNEQIAQWIFLKPYIEQRADFGMKILCLVPKNLEPELRFMRCSASAQDDGREIEKACRRKIIFP